MKNFTLLAIATIFCGFAQAQVLDSDFSSWTDDLPDGWVGSKSNIGAENILQADNSGGQGDYAVELVNAETQHKRFTTQPITVEAGENYEITFWARGNGDLRTGLFDDREGGFGYVYNSYVSLSSDTWEEYSQSIIAEENTDIAEFILSVRSTSGDLNVQIDRVTISTAEITTVSVHDIQYSENPDGSSPYAGQAVTTGGIVSAVGADGFFIQNGIGPWSGIFVFSFQETNMGDSVVFSANVVEYFDMTQLSGTNSFTTLSSGNPVVKTNISTQQVNEEAYEGVVVKVWNATCTDGNIGNGQFTVDDGTGDCIINPVIYEYDGIFGETYNITGPVFYSFEEFKIMPRSADDVEISTGISEANDADGIQVFPNPAKETLNIQWTGNESGVVEYQMYDVSGQLVLRGALQQPLASVELGSLSPGWYSLQMNDGDSLRHVRVVVER